ncbi:hypothetical protein ACHAXT_011240 [Thalassiosira profunda]
MEGRVVVNGNGLAGFGRGASPTVVSGSDSSLDGLQEEKMKLESISLLPKSSRSSVHRKACTPNGGRLNKFVRRLHEMLTAERDGGVVEWKRGMLVLHNINAFSEQVLPKYFRVKNFKTFRRQLNYYGFLHVRSFAAPGDSTTALWVNQELANGGDDSISSVLKLKRVEPNDSSKTPKERRERKNSAANAAEAGGLGTLLPGYTTNVSISLPCTSFQAPPAPVTPTLEKETYDASQFGGVYDPMIDQAAGLLLSLSHARA